MPSPNPYQPETLECHFGIAMTGAVLNALNIRLDADAIACNEAQ